VQSDGDVQQDCSIVSLIVIVNVEAVVEFINSLLEFSLFEKLAGNLF